MFECQSPEGGKKSHCQIFAERVAPIFRRLLAAIRHFPWAVCRQHWDVTSQVRIKIFRQRKWRKEWRGAKAMRTGSELTQIDWNINCPFSSPKTDESAQNSESPRWGRRALCVIVTNDKVLSPLSHQHRRTHVKSLFYVLSSSSEILFLRSPPTLLFYQLKHCTKRLLIVYFAPKDVWEISSSYKLKRISNIAATSGAHYIMERVIWWISSSHDKLNRKRVSYSLYLAYR